MVILRLKMCFFWGFKNYNFLRSKSYTVTKNAISPQRKLGSYAHKIVVYHQPNFHKDLLKDARARIFIEISYFLLIRLDLFRLLSDIPYLDPQRGLIEK